MSKVSVDDKLEAFLSQGKRCIQCHQTYKEDANHESACRLDSSWVCRGPGTSVGRHIIHRNHFAGAAHCGSVPFKSRAVARYHPGPTSKHTGVETWADRILFKCCGREQKSTGNCRQDAEPCCIGRHKSGEGI
mmetsp:Transcript_22145/g.34727  ORF Transcript_22145/g.34727 Transcript_22145/m.34727 type:complete len:133 (-) Transcript_22145:192-590(-)